MSLYRIASLLLFLNLLMISQVTFAQTTEKINFKWLYFRGDPAGAEETGFDDREWRIVKLPHDASVYGIPGEKVGWYRKHIELFGNLGKRKIYIEFEGVLGSYEFWVNDQKLGRVSNGLKDTIFDLTPYMHIGENLIALRYDASALAQDGITGEGLFRNVWVHFNNELHVSHEGITFEWTEGTENTNTLKLTAKVLNLRDAASFCNVIVTLTDPSGRMVWSGNDSIYLESGDSYPFKFDIHLSDPVKWSVANPAEYTAGVKIKDRDGVVDVHEESVCLRNTVFGPPGMAILNGDTLQIKVIHYDPVPGPLGMAEHDRVIDRNLRTIKEMGFNGICPDPVFDSQYLEAWCESNGMLIVHRAENMVNVNDLMDRCGFLTVSGDSLMIEENPDYLDISRDFSTDNASRLVLNPDRRAIEADGFDLLFITIRVADNHGLFGDQSGTLIKIRVKGAADIAGVGNADPLVIEPSQASEIKLYNGKALLILRSNQRKGDIEIKASGRGLKSSTIIIQAI